MRDVDGPHDDSIVEDLVDHPEFAAPGRVPPFQSIAKWLADAMRILR
jgi:hypothetical protein